MYYSDTINNDWSIPLYCYKVYFDDVDLFQCLTSIPEF